MPFHIRPFFGKNAEHHAVTDRPIPPGIVMAEYTVLVSAKSRYRPLRCEVEVVSPQPDDTTTQRFERVREQQQFADCIDVTALPAFGVPGVADLNSINLWHYIVISRATHDCASRQLPDRPRQHVARLLAIKCVSNVHTSLLWLRHESE